jgi:PhnB protein
MYKPDGYGDVAAYLICPGAAGVITFLEQALDARVLRSSPRADGTLAHAEVRIGDTVVMFGEAAPKWPAAPTHLHVYVPDVHVAWRRALDAGARPLREPARSEGDTDTRGGFLDPAGNSWWIATQGD